MAENSTTPLQSKVSSYYRVGDIIVFKYEGNIRACVTGHELLDGKVWLVADAACLHFIVPVAQVVGGEPREEG
jgi:hypothetical protein